MTWLRFLFLAALAGVLSLVGACGGGGGSDSGTVQLALTDEAHHEFAEVVIAIEEVRAVPAGEEEDGEGGLPLIVQYDPPLVVDVLELAYQQQLLGEATLPAGTYSQLRLVLAGNNPPPPANYIVLADDPLTEIPVDTPSGQQSGLKVLGEFTVGEGETAVVVLDFDPERAIVQAGQSGKWIFKPTGIRVVETGELLPAYGALAGSVVTEVAGQGGVLTEEPVAGAKVLAIPEGSVSPIAAGVVNPEDGSFRLLLPAGFYDLRVEAEGFEPFVTGPPPFEVVLGQDTDAGVLLLTPLPGS